MTVASATNGFSMPQVLRLTGYGVLLWAAGVLFLRFAASVGWLSGSAQLLVYFLVIPATVPLLRLVPPVGGVDRSALVPAVALVSLTALLIDGIVIGYVPWVYASDPDRARACAGALLWAVGVAMALSFLMAPRAPR